MEIDETVSKLLEKVTTLESQVKDLYARVSSLEANKKPISAMKTETEGDHVRNPSDVVIDAKIGEMPASAEGRIKCPKCGSTNFSVHEDKEHPISYVAGKGIYPKKNTCRKCGNIWS